MNLKEHLSAMSQSERESFAFDCKTTMGHLRNVMYGYRRCSAELASAIERTSAGVVTRQLMRPDDWRDIWPELAAAAAEHAQVAIATQGI